MITKIRLKNFKCFEDETIGLTPLNLWTGLNGMGKSTLIQALLLLRQNYELGLLENDNRISLNGELVKLGNSKDLLYQYFKNQQIILTKKPEMAIVFASSLCGLVPHWPRDPGGRGFFYIWRIENESCLVFHRWLQCLSFLRQQ